MRSKWVRTTGSTSVSPTVRPVIHASTTTSSPEGCATEGTTGILGSALDGTHIGGVEHGRCELDAPEKHRLVDMSRLRDGVINTANLLVNVSVMLRN